MTAADLSTDNNQRLHLALSTLAGAPWKDFAAKSPEDAQRILASLFNPAAVLR